MCCCPKCPLHIVAPEWALTLDHVNNDGAKDRGGGRGSKGGRSFAALLRARGWPNEPPLQALCAVCQLGKVRNGGVCPHLG